MTVKRSRNPIERAYILALLTIGVETYEAKLLESRENHSLIPDPLQSKV